MKFARILLFLVAIAQIAVLHALIEEPLLRNRFGFIGQSGKQDPEQSIELNWVPELSITATIADKIDIQGEYSIQSRFYHHWQNSGTEQNISAESYRYWIRISTARAELRAGLQRLNFGSAHVLRPLQWFDRINPLDANEETKGVEALLFRYYFINNANIWVWGINSDDEIKGNEWHPSSGSDVEYGGRIMSQIGVGEAAFSFHQRDIGIGGTGESLAENRLGYDVRIDTIVGLWVEGSLSHYEDSDFLQIQKHSSITFGVDYTFGIGNGLYTMLETNLSHSSTGDYKKLYNDGVHSALLLDYPLGLLDTISLLNLVDHKNSKSLHTLILRRSYDYLSLELGFTHDLNRKYNGLGMQGIRLVVNYAI